MSGWTPPPLPGWWATTPGPVLEGRGTELDALETARRAADEGRRQLVVISGEAGAGKSRLSAELVRPVAADGAATVLVGHCLPDYPVAYEPFREPVEAMITATDAVAPARLTEVRRLVNALLSGEDEQARAGAAPLDTTRDRFDAVVETLVGLCRDRLVILVLEDLQWATPSTTALLSYVVRRVTSARLLVVATYRSNPPDHSADVTGALAELLRLDGTHRVELGGLDADAVEALVRAVAPSASDSASRLATHLRRLTTGNPFLLLEICRDLNASGDVGADLERIAVPLTLRDAVAARLAPLDEDDRWLVELAAVLGERIDVPLLRGCAADPVQVLPALERAAGLGLVIADLGGVGLRFQHALARQAILDHLDATAPVRHAELHAVAARGLESNPATTLPAVRRLAYHYAHAHTLAHSRAKVREYLSRAAVLAKRSFAYEEAAETYHQVAQLSDAEQDRDDALLQVIDCHLYAGHFQAASEASLHLAHHGATAALRLEGAIWFEAAAEIRVGQSGAVGVLVAALRDVRIDLSDRLSVRGLAAVSRALARAGDVDAALRVGGSALAAARTMQDPVVLRHVLHRMLSVTGDEPGHVPITLSRGSELARLSRDQGGQGDNLGAGMSKEFCTESIAELRCQTAFAVGNLDDARAASDDLHAVATRSGHAWFDYFGWLAEGGLCFLTGDFVGAERRARQARRASTDWPDAETEQLYGTQMFLVRRETGRLGDVAGRLTGTETAASAWAPGLLGLYTELGMRRPVRRLMEVMATPEALAANRGTPFWPASLAHLCEAALLVRDRDVLSRLRPLLAEFTGLYLVTRPFVGLYGPADRYLATLDAALDRGDPLTLLDAAESLDRSSGASVHLATTLATRARYLARRDGRTTRRVGEAMEGARAIAAPIGQARVLRILSDLTSPHSPASAANGAAAAGLTGREIEVLRLLVQGASNQEIADTLVISHNTAAKHVQAILTKTHTQKRTRAAHHAVTHGWVDPDEAG